MSLGRRRALLAQISQELIAIRELLVEVANTWDIEIGEEPSQ